MGARARGKAQGSEVHLEYVTYRRVTPIRPRGETVGCGYYCYFVVLRLYRRARLSLSLALALALAPSSSCHSLVCRSYALHYSLLLAESPRNIGQLRYLRFLRHFVLPKPWPPPSCSRRRPSSALPSSLAEIERLPRRRAGRSFSPDDESPTPPSGTALAPTPSLPALPAHTQRHTHRPRAPAPADNTIRHTTRNTAPAGGVQGPRVCAGFCCLSASLASLALASVASLASLAPRPVSPHCLFLVASGSPSLPSISHFTISPCAICHLPVGTWHSVATRHWHETTPEHELESRRTTKTRQITAWRGLFHSGLVSWALA